MSEIWNGFYRFVRPCVRIALGVMHPRLRVIGRENIPEGAAVICCNHASMSDPLWVIWATRAKRVPRCMAKKELMDVPVLGWLLKKLGVFGVDREGNDIGAVKTALRVLRDGEKLIIFPEGTRVKDGKKSEPHNGAMMMALRSGAPILPVYCTARKRFWRRVDVVFGKPYLPEIAGRRPTGEELDRYTAEMMQIIYDLGAEK